MANQVSDPHALSQSQVAARAREQEDVAVNDLIIRHTAGVRLTHWLMAIFFFLAALTGFTIFTPYFAGLAGLFGGGPMTRFLHPWFSLGFVIPVLFLFIAWRKRMQRDAGDEEWRKNIGAYLRYEMELREVGKYNAGQKLFFWSVVWGAIAMLVSGIVMWFPTSFHWIFRMIAYWLHEIAFIAFVVGTIYHLYMSTAAMPGTLRAMTRGTVTKAWARWHHPRWYREVTGEEK
jgi:formate dehydrogenase subunit gamma